MIQPADPISPPSNAPSNEPTSAPGVTLTTYECTGAAVVVLENRNPAGYSVRARLVLHTGSTSDFGTSQPRTGKAGEKPPEVSFEVVGFGGLNARFD